MPDDFTVIIPATEADYNKYFEQSFNHFGKWNRKIIYAYGHKDPPIAVRLYNALMKSETEFIVLCAIDDIMYLEAIEEGLRLLQDQTALSCFTGQFLQNDEIMYRKLEQGIFNFNDYWANYVSVIWGIHRRSILKQTFTFMKQFHIGESCTKQLGMELVIALFASARGRIAISNNIIGERERR